MKIQVGWGFLDQIEISHFLPNLRRLPPTWRKFPATIFNREQHKTKWNVIFSITKSKESPEGKGDFESQVGFVGQLEFLGAASKFWKLSFCSKTDPDEHVCSKNDLWYRLKFSLFKSIFDIYSDISLILGG